MKTKTLKKNKVNVITLGCSKNIYDSEVMMSQLKANNFDVEHENNDLDSSTVIINTCGSPRALPSSFKGVAIIFTSSPTSNIPSPSRSQL